MIAATGARATQPGHARQSTVGMPRRQRRTLASACAQRMTMQDAPMNNPSRVSIATHDFRPTCIASRFLLQM